MSGWVDDEISKKGRRGPGVWARRFALLRFHGSMVLVLVLAGGGGRGPCKQGERPVAVRAWSGV